MTKQHNNFLVSHLPSYISHLKLYENETTYYLLFANFSHAHRL